MALARLAVALLLPHACSSLRTTIVHQLHMQPRTSATMAAREGAACAVPSIVRVDSTSHLRAMLTALPGRQLAVLFGSKRCRACRTAEREFSRAARLRPEVQFAHILHGVGTHAAFTEHKIALLPTVCIFLNDQLVRSVPCTSCQELAEELDEVLQKGSWDIWRA